MIVENLEITKENYKDVCKKLSLPYCFFENTFSNRKIELPDHAGFYDIETENDESFLFGFVNNRKFTDPQEMLQYLQQFPVICGFNSYRFDNRILFSLCPGMFTKKTINRFDIFLVDGPINIDMLPFYQLWKPFKASHKLDYLARDLGIERKFSLENKEQKCQEDAEITKAFYPHTRQIALWIYKNFQIDPSYLSSMPSFQFSKLRRWMLQIYLLKHGILPELMRKDSKKEPHYFTYCKRGFYKNINAFDIKSAYPTTAIKLNCSLYKEGDFASFLKFLIEERKNNPQIQETIKWVCNAIIGDMNCTDGILYDKSIMADVWNTFKTEMEKWIKATGKKNVIYSYTDCIFTPLNEVPKMEGYEVSLKHRLEWIAVFNITRILGLNENGKIHRTHFNRVPAQLKMYDYIEAEIDKTLKENPIKFLNMPHNPIDIKSLPEDAFKIVIRKDGNTCTNIDYLRIWPKLSFGFNEIFFTDKGSITTDPSKIGYIHYQKLLNNYLRLYRMKVKP